MGPVVAGWLMWWMDRERSVLPVGQGRGGVDNFHIREEWTTSTLGLMSRATIGDPVTNWGRWVESDSRVREIAVLVGGWAEVE